MQKIKKCYHCKKNKAIKFFGKNKGRRDGLQSSCKNCKSEINKKYYKENKAKCIERIGLGKRKRALHNYTRLVTKYFSKPCVDCNEIYHPSSMVFDHISSKSKNIYKTEGVMYLVRSGYSWKAIKKEVDKCAVRCQNCHFLKTSKDFEHWSEIADLVDDHARLIRKLYKYNGNFLEIESFNEQKRDISSKFSGFMKEQINKVIEKKKGKIK